MENHHILSYFIIHTKYLALFLVTRQPGEPTAASGKRINITVDNEEQVTLFPAWISKHMPSEVWDDITYSFPNFNGTTVEVWGWISNFIPDFIMGVITYPCWD